MFSCQHVALPQTSSLVFLFCQAAHEGTIHTVKSDLSGVVLSVGKCVQSRDHHCCQGPAIQIFRGFSGPVRPFWCCGRRVGFCSHVGFSLQTHLLGLLCVETLPRAHRSSRAVPLQPQEDTCAGTACVWYFGSTRLSCAGVCRARVSSLGFCAFVFTADFFGLCSRILSGPPRAVVAVAGPRSSIFVVLGFMSSITHFSLCFDFSVEFFMIPVHSTTGWIVAHLLASAGPAPGFPVRACICPLPLVPRPLTWWQGLMVTCPQPSLMSRHVAVPGVLAPQGAAVLSLQFSFRLLRHKSSLWLTLVQNLPRDHSRSVGPEPRTRLSWPNHSAGHCRQ